MHTLTIMLFFKKKLRPGDHFCSGSWESHKIYSINTWRWLARLCHSHRFDPQKKKKEKKNPIMATEWPYRQRRQYLTPPAWELKRGVRKCTKGRADQDSRIILYLGSLVISSEALQCASHARTGLYPARPKSTICRRKNKQMKTKISKFPRSS